MRFNFIGSAVGIILRLFSLMLLLPCIVAIIEKDYFSIIPFAVASGLSLLLGLILKINQDYSLALLTYF